MANRYNQGIYKPKNKEKYVGNHEPRYLSGWELAFMRMADNHPSVIAWASEPFKIPYRNPVTGNISGYLPDFLISYVDRKGKKITELIEIKPSCQTLSERAKSQRDKLALAVNMAKWKAAKAWADKHGIRFRVVNEHHIF